MFGSSDVASTLNRPSTALTQVQEAKANEEADKARREVTETRNDADSLIYQCEKSMTDLGDKVSRDVHVGQYLAQVMAVCACAWCSCACPSICR